ncbi:MAG: penicillin-binding transpeptidase domain-containing protein, partial [Anaerolineae bacterium]
MVLDVRTSFVTKEGTPYVPLNYDLTFRGPVRVREALASSYNLVAVKVLDTIGIETMTGLARRLGIDSFDDPERLGLAITLGGGEVRLLDLTAAYAAFANGGRRVHPVVVKRVEDAEGELLWAAEPGVGARVLDERVSYLITDILSDDLARLPTFGEGSPLHLSRPAAVKTGTTTDFRDNWTVGYTPDLVAGVWVGNVDNEAMHDVTGVTGAAPIWNGFMEAALKGAPEQAFTRPEGLHEVEICALSGLLPGPDCPHRVKEIFIEGTEPTEICDLHQRIGGEVYAVLPPEAQTWAQEQGWPQPPEEASVDPDSGSLLLLVSPDEGALYRIDPALPRDDQRLSITAVAGGDLRRVTLRVDGLPVAEFTEPPYTVLWRLEPGDHVIQAAGEALDGSQVRSDEVWIGVR